MHTSLEAVTNGDVFSGLEDIFVVYLVIPASDFRVSYTDHSLGGHFARISVKCCQSCLLTLTEHQDQGKADDDEKPPAWITVTHLIFFFKIFSLALSIRFKGEILNLSLLHVQRSCSSILSKSDTDGVLSIINQLYMNSYFYMVLHLR